MKVILTLNPENATEEEIKSYPLREAVRAVLLDNDNNFGIVYVKKDNYYKIPGGGIEKGEDRKTALKRESLEETGCDIEIIAEIGKIIEYRKMFGLTQISYGYLARLKGIKANPKYEEDELEDGFGPLWVPYDKALKLFSENSGSIQEASDYMVPRDLYFLKSAKNYFSKLLSD